MESSEKKLRILSDRILEINEMTDIRRKVQECYKLFVDVLKNEDLYIIGLPNTTKDDWEKGKLIPFIGNIKGNDDYYIRVFTNEELALRMARREKCILEDEELVTKVTAKALLALIENYFMMGMDGVLLNDGEEWITINSELILSCGYKEIFNEPERLNADFMNTVRAIYDIAKNRVNMVAPVKYYDGIKPTDVFEGKAELYPFGNEILFVDYSDRFKIEDVFKEKVYWLEMNISMFYSVVVKAKEMGIANIKIAYKGKQGNGTPENILELLDSVGFSGIK